MEVTSLYSFNRANNKGRVKGEECKQTFLNLSQIV